MQRQAPIYCFTILLASAAWAQLSAQVDSAIPLRTMSLSALAPDAEKVTAPPDTAPALYRIQPKDVSCTAWTSDTITPSGARVYPKRDVDVPPKILRPGVREYPVREERAGHGGRVVMRLVVDTLGRAEPCSVSTITITDPVFRDAAYRMVVTSTFAPGKLDGKRVPVLVLQAVTFAP